jgi:hypothetical protein
MTFHSILFRNKAGRSPERRPPPPEYFESLRLESQKLTADLSTLRYCMHINGLEVQVCSYDKESDYIADIEETFERFKQGAVKEYGFTEIARQIISALVERPAKVVCVTHLYELARGFAEKKADMALFLRAEREIRGARTFKMLEGEPLQTSFEEDLYKSIFHDNKTMREL